MGEIVDIKSRESWDTDLLNTLTAAARWEKIAGLVASSGQQVLYDDYMGRHGRYDANFLLHRTEHDVKFLYDLYVFVANEAKRKELRALFRENLASPVFCEGGPLAEMVWPLKQTVDEYDFLAKHNCHPPDGGDDA
jgi:hypothetical protein